MNPSPPEPTPFVPDPDARRYHEDCAWCVGAGTYCGGPKAYPCGCCGSHACDLDCA